MKRLLLLAFLLPGASWADVPPPLNYVENCTEKKQCKPNEDGDTCGAWYSEPDKCKKLHASDGFIFKCRTSGASVWREIYCRPKAQNKTKKEK